MDPTQLLLPGWTCRGEVRWKHEHDALIAAPPEGWESDWCAACHCHCHSSTCRLSRQQLLSPPLLMWHQRLLFCPGVQGSSHSHSLSHSNTPRKCVWKFAAGSFGWWHAQAAPCFRSHALSKCLWKFAVGSYVVELDNADLQAEYPGDLLAKDGWSFDKACCCVRCTVLHCAVLCTEQAALCSRGAACAAWCGAAVPALLCCRHWAQLRAQLPLAAHRSLVAGPGVCDVQ